MLSVVVHGWNAKSSSHFFPFVTKELEKMGSEVICPDMPNTKYPKLTEWKEFLAKKINGRTVDLFIGHSLGGVLAMSMLTKGDIKIKYLITIGSSPGWKSDDELNNFLNPVISFGKIKQAVSSFTVVHSYDDPHCAFEYGMILVKQAGATGIFYENKGHFLHKRLPKNLIDYIKILIKPQK